jgi:hypothetical protein
VNCFDWQNRASEYLDGSLIGNLKREADEHVESCEDCGTRHKHYRLLLSSIASQPRTSLPVAIRKAPLSAPIHPLSKAQSGVSWMARLRKWSNVPWYIRVPAEGASIVLLVTLAISAGPRLRTIYERKVERSLTEYNEGFGTGTENAPDDGDTALARGNITTDPATGAHAQLVSDETVAEGGDSDGDAGDNDDEADAPEIHVGKAEVWRFNMKTDSPHGVRPQIVRLLTELKVPSNTPGFGGIEAPGGIQFDLMVTKEIIPEVKAALEKMAPPPPKDLADSPFGETFTWYKNKSKKPIPSGKARLVIWLSQI